MGGGDRGTGRQRPGPGGGGEIQLARLHGGGFELLWCCSVGKPLENSELG